jgi:hypothetical protein
LLPINEPNWEEIEKRLDTLDVTCILTEENGRIDDSFHRCAANHSIWIKLQLKYEGQHFSLEEFSLTYLMNFLFEIEGYLNLVMDFVVYALMKRHHDIWSDVNQSFISSFDEISLIPLSVKLKFLENHGFGFFSELCHRELRNAVTHQNCRLDSKGDVVYGKKNTRLKMEDLAQINNNISLFVAKFFVFIKKKSRPLK